MNASQDGQRVMRFGFGDNWSRFLRTLNEEQIVSAEDSLQRMLTVSDLKGLTFLDIGSGSGLFSLSARRLGARVRSFDYDPRSVSCANELKARYFPNDSDWTIEQGSALDQGYLKSLGHFDIVYSWGVLHHTGDMWQALDNACMPVADGGRLFISIYNDQGFLSQVWKQVKKIYNALPGPLKLPYALCAAAPMEARSLLYSLAILQPQRYARLWTEYRNDRGMSRWYDLIDWIGGYPFEYAKPEEIFDFYRNHGFNLVRLKTCGGGHGCNEYLFEKRSA